MFHVLSMQSSESVLFLIYSVTEYKNIFYFVTFSSTVNTSLGTCVTRSSHFSSYTNAISRPTMSTTILVLKVHLTLSV